MENIDWEKSVQKSMDLEKSIQDLGGTIPGKTRGVLDKYKISEEKYNEQMKTWLDQTYKDCNKTNILERHLCIIKKLKKILTRPGVTPEQIKNVKFWINLLDEMNNEYYLPFNEQLNRMKTLINYR
ncbi:MAG: hypothetical protein AABY22_03590 [Nanoarchaeota archaeon]